METASGVTKTEPLVFCLSEWAEGAPLAFEKGEEETIARMKANALDRLVAAGKIEDQDRERVQFIVYILVDPPKREDAACPS